MKIFPRSSILFLTHVEPGRKRECYRFRIKIIIYNIRHADINHLHSHYHSDLHVVRDRNIFRQSSLLRQSHSTLSLSSGIRNCVNEAAFSFLIHPSHDAFNREILVEHELARRDIFTRHCTECQQNYCAYSATYSRFRAQHFLLLVYALHILRRDLAPLRASVRQFLTIIVALGKGLSTKQRLFCNE